MEGEDIGENYVPMSFGQPQIPHGLDFIFNPVHRSESSASDLVNHGTAPLYVT